jgi:tripartite-type tricarboxylate transporter receptor subunit TctC
VQQRLLGLGVRPGGGTPQELESLLDEEIRRWRSVIQAAKIEPQ